MSLGVEERLPWRGGPHGNPDGRLWLHHSVRAKRAVGRMLAEHVQAAQLLLPHLRSHWHPGEKLPRELPFRWESASSSQPTLYFCPLFKILHFTFGFTFHFLPPIPFFHTLFAQDLAVLFFPSSFFLLGNFHFFPSLHLHALLHTSLPLTSYIVFWHLISFFAYFSLLHSFSPDPKDTSFYLNCFTAV